MANRKTQKKKARLEEKRKQELAEKLKDYPLVGRNGTR